MAPSRPLRILLLERIHPVATQALERAGFLVDSESRALSEAELSQRLAKVDVLGIRSKTDLSASLFQKHPHLLCVGAFCIGTNQIALEAANRQGIPVFNAPYSNTRSVAELVLCEIIALARQLGDRNLNAHRGVWQKDAEGAHEVRGKVLGIVGYGHIGSQVSVLAEALGLRVYYYDIIKKLPLGNSTATESLQELLEVSDFVTLHVPETPQTKNMIGDNELQRMKPQSFLINASRGSVVEIAALANALQRKHLAGAAIDVFPVEPESTKDAFTSELQGLKNVILTPHVGGSTEEAQEAIGREVAHSFVEFLKNGSTTGAVNFPVLDLQPVQGASRILNVHKNVPGVLKSINTIVSELGANISAQHLATDPHLGYLVMDVEGTDAQAVCERITQLPTTIKARIVD